SERNNPKHDPPYLILRLLKKVFYPFADGFVFQTNNVTKYFGGIINKKSCIIPNPLNDNILNFENADHKQKVIVTVGRLEKQKDQQTLINAFAIVRKRNPDYKLAILGDGNLRQQLEEQIQKLGIRDHVSLLGK